MSYSSTSASMRSCSSHHASSTVCEKRAWAGGGGSQASTGGSAARNCRGSQSQGQSRASFGRWMKRTSIFCSIHVFLSEKLWAEWSVLSIASGGL